MFWSAGRVSSFLQIKAFLLGRPQSLVPYSIQKPTTGTATIGQARDAPGIAKLLNEFFEPASSRCQTAVTVEWVLSTFVNGAIWVVVKDRGHTIRGCIASIPCPSPYLGTTQTQWGQVDWYCVHPLWRSKGLGTSLLETLDYATYIARRRAHVFLKEGMPLPLPHMPVYVTRLYCRRAGNPAVHLIPEQPGVYPYQTKEKATGLPLVRVDPCADEISIDEWEESLDTFLPPCIVFVSVAPKSVRWEQDSLVSMYAFRWVAGKWFGSRPNSAIL